MINFSFERKSNISLVFSTSKVYYACVLEFCDFFHESNAFFTCTGQMKELVLRISATAISSELIS